MFLRKGVTKICSKSTGEQQYRIAISLARVFFCKFAAYFWNTFSQEHLWVAAFEHSEIFHKIDLFTNHKHLTSSEIGSGAIFNCVGFSFAITWGKKSIFKFDPHNSSRYVLNILNVQASLLYILNILNAQASLLEFRLIKIWLSWNLIINEKRIWLRNTYRTTVTVHVPCGMTFSTFKLRYPKLQISKCSGYSKLVKKAKECNKKHLCKKAHVECRKSLQF